MCKLPFLLQRSEVPLESGADLVEKFHQRMAKEAGAGRLGVEVIGCGPAKRKMPSEWS